MRLLTVILLTAAAAGAEQAWKITAFGNSLSTPEWNRRLGMSAVRIGCGGAPGDCLARLESTARDQGVQEVYLAMGVREKPALAPEHLLQYSRLSLEHPVLKAVTIDDFVALYRRWRAASPESAEAFEAALSKAKATNPRFRFGLTLYENEIPSPLLAEPNLTAATRARIDLVFLYLHYRANGPHYERYVAETKKLFPKAAIIAGAYAYDRIEYLPCAQTGKAKCTLDEELDFFRTSIEIQARLLREGKIEAIEFYPAAFGAEAQWTGWEKPRICPAEKKADCVRNTLRLREIALAVLNAHKPPR